jgi:hypothetical protein
LTEDLTKRDLTQIVERVPRAIIGLGVIGVAAGAVYRGPGWAAAFLVGVIAAWWNFRFVEWMVTALVRRATAKPASKPKLSGFRVFAQLGLFVAGVFVILHFSGLNLTAAAMGFLVCPAAVMLESIYYLLITYGHS